jgi:hypothetical protein
LLDRAVEKKVIARAGNTYNYQLWIDKNTFEDKVLGKSYDQAKVYLESPENKKVYDSIWHKIKGL